MSAPTLRLNTNAAKVLKAVSEFCGDRQPIDAIGFDADGAVATDSYTLCTVPVAELGTWQDAPDGILSAEPKPLLAAIKTAGHNAKIVWHDALITVEGDGGAVTFVAPDKPYIPVKKLFPNIEDGPHPVGAYNFEFLGRFGKLAKALKWDALTLVPSAAPERLKASLVMCPARRTVLGLIMPKRVG